MKQKKLSTTNGARTHVWPVAIYSQKKQCNQDLLETTASETLMIGLFEALVLDNNVDGGATTNLHRFRFAYMSVMTTLAQPQPLGVEMQTLANGVELEFGRVGLGHAARPIFRVDRYALGRASIRCGQHEVENALRVVAASVAALEKMFDDAINFGSHEAEHARRRLVRGRRVFVFEAATTGVLRAAVVKAVVGSMLLNVLPN